jgi:hypothetical protein
MRYRVTYKSAAPDEEIDAETVVVEPGWFHFITDGITVALIRADVVERIDLIEHNIEGRHHGR